MEPVSPLPRAIPFVGRRAELARLASLAEEGVRLVTLLGPGGIGKTALAVEHASAQPNAVFCELVAAKDEAGIVDAMAAALSTHADVGAALAARGEVVAIVDNFDGLTDHALATIGAWLDSAPELRVIVTSRERLALASEVVIEVGPLDDATALLAAAASKRGTPYVLRAADEAPARALADLLDGLPLALEMVGAQLPLFGVPAMLERVRAGTASLARDVRGGPARHASLEAAVAGSVAALPPEARSVLADLTVFRGGFTAVTMSEVLGAAAVNALPLLLSRSLVRTSDAAAARFDLYAAVRAFAGPASVESSEAHTAYFVARAERADRAWLALEQTNVMAVVHRALESAVMSAAGAEPALRALVALSPALLQRSALAQVAALVTPLIERTRDSGADPRLTARVMLIRGALRRERADIRGALKDLLGAETIARALSDVLLAADLRVELGRTLLTAGELRPAREHFQRAQEAFAQLGARDREAHALAWLGFATANDDVAAARPLLERASALGKDAVYLLLVGRAAADLGDRAAARSALDGASHATDAEVRAAALVLRGVLAHDEGDLSPDSRGHDLFAVSGLAADAAEARGLVGLLAKEQGRDAEAYALLAEARDTLVAHGDDASLFEGVLGLPITPSRRAPSLVRGWARGPRSIYARVARRAGGAPAPLAADALVVGARGAWFVAPGGSRIGLERRASLALLLDRLAEERVARPGHTLAAAELFRATWPGEKAQASAAAHRVRVAVATLRKLGLRDALVTLEGGGGYALAATVSVVRA